MDFSRLRLTILTDAVVAVTPEGTLTYWSDEAELLFGYTALEALGRPLLDLIVPPNYREEARHNLAATLEQGSSRLDTVRHRKDGSLLHVSVRAAQVPDGDTGTMHVVYSHRDVAIRTPGAPPATLDGQFRDLLESMPDGIVMVDAEGRIVLANGQAETLFGYDRNQLVGHRVETLLPHRYRDAHILHRTRFVAQPRVRTMGAGLELFGQRRDGSEFPVEISLSPLHTPKGTLVMSAVRDITARREVERSLREKNVELVNANLAKDRFLAGMSHELRTPLNAIIGFTGTMLMRLPGPLTPEQEKQLRTVQSSARHLLELINTILDLSKIEVGKMDVFPERFHLERVMDEVCAVIAPIAKAKDILVRKHLADDMETVTLDLQKFKQVLYNLLTNAVKFTENGGYVDIVATLYDDTRLQLDVRDTGIGIRPEDLDKLFVEFQQLDGFAARSREGTGLGLVLTRKLVELQGGSITARSEPGRGTTFTVVLPLQLEVPGP